MKRRDFLKLSGAIGVAVVAPGLVGEEPNELDEFDEGPWNWPEITVGPPGPTTYYISADGDNSDGHSWGTAYKTISDLDKARKLSDGSVVYFGYDW